MILAPAVNNRPGSPCQWTILRAASKIEKEGFFKGREEARGEPTAVESGPEAVPGAAEVMTDGGSVEAGIDADEEDDEVFGGEIRDSLVVRGEELGFGGFPAGRQCPVHSAASLRVSCPRPCLS
jgi:hypothetical protein